MTLTAKRCKSRRAFTLLEIVIALVLSALVMAGAVGLLKISNDEHALKKASRELEGLAKRARLSAVLKQTPYALVFREGEVAMMPWAEAAHASAPDDEADGTNEEKRWLLTFDNGMQVVTRRWNEVEWITLRGRERQIWRFDPNGLCEPIGVRLTMNQHVMELAFHPLTAAVSTSALETP
jgi:prepilin-type N-terminal cleavage/methylation domain-containing protein